MKPDIYCEKAQYLAGEEVVLLVEIQQEKRQKAAVLMIYDLYREIRRIELLLEKGINRISLGKYEAGLKGYTAVLETDDEKGIKNRTVTSFDVEYRAEDSIRYGFLSDFRKADGENDYDVENLRKYHINYLQFYDWSYRHDQLVSLQENYQDMMGKSIHLPTIRHKVQKAAQYGMKSLGYGAVYAASREFYEKHKDWAFYNSAGEVFRFIQVFYIMNICRESPWHNHIIEEYRRAITEIGFAGIHMDTYGFPKTAWSQIDDTPRLIHLEKEFPYLIDDTFEQLSKEGMTPSLIFNNVGNWPVTTVTDTKQAAIYIEIWKPYEKYYHIRQIIRQARQADTTNKTIILAAYLEPFRTESRERASYSAYILTAAIVSLGASHLLLGEENAVLTQGYYNDYSKLDQEQALHLRTYYDFMIQYLQLFYAPDLQDVTMTHMGWDNYEYQCLFDHWSVDGEAGKIWVTVRENEKYKCLYLINLSGCSDDYWNRGKEKPLLQYDKRFRVHIDREITGVYLATPDQNNGISQSLAYQEIVDERGRFIEFCVPRLEIWSLIYIESK